MLSKINLLVKIEILVKLENDIVTIRPIAGTRKRGKNLKEDLKLEKDLLKK